MKLYKTVSYIFHPILFPIIGTLLYFILLPRHISSHSERTIILTVFVTTYLLPMLFVSLLKKMKMVDSYEIETIDERKFPFILLIIVSYSLGMMLHKTSIVDELSIFYFGTTLALLVAYILLHINFKISLHTIGIGGMIAFIGILSFTYQLNLILILALFFIIAGFIMTSRLKLKRNKGKEVYIGFILGFFTQIIIYALLTLV